jgi:predicted transcriptional regulator
MTLSIDLQPDVERGLQALAEAKGVSLSAFAQEVLAREALPLQEKETRTGRELIEAGASIRGLFTDDEIDHLFNRSHSVSSPVDFS